MLNISQNVKNSAQLLKWKFASTVKDMQPDGLKNNDFVVLNLLATFKIFKMR